MSRTASVTRALFTALAIMTTAALAGEWVVDLDELAPHPDAYWDGADLAGGFTSGLTFFQNSYTPTPPSGGYWSGFAYSRVNDTTTAGWGNQYAVISGTDVDGDGTYAVAYDSSWDEQDIIALPAPAVVKGFYVNNTTYAALAMRDGNGPAKKFGGTTGDDEDWFKLSITGRSGEGEALGTVDIYLADFRFAENTSDYIIEDWTWVDCTSMGPGIRTLHFTLSSSDNGDWGMNTPAYFALDNLTFACGPTPLEADLDALTPDANGFWKGADLSGGFRDGGFHFRNSFTPTPAGGYWGGFAYSRVNDTNTPGWLNEFAVISGTDVSGDGTYSVAFDSSWDEQDIITLPTPSYVDGFFVNNTTYAALAMKNGEAPANKFGGASGDDPDWFKLAVSGKGEDGTFLGEVSFYLADFRATNNVEDYIVTEWTWVDLSSIGPDVKTLHFSLSSSDVGTWGMNTPAYFALDGLSATPSFSGPAANTNPWDAGIPGFVGPDGEGNANGPGNGINPLIGAWVSAVVDYAPSDPYMDERFINVTNVFGPVTGNSLDVISLGDVDSDGLASNVPPGEITLTFPVTIEDGDGPDFAVFENGLVETNVHGVFGELGYVEVSSDGTNFARFASVSLSTNQLMTYDLLPSRDIYNLCGKHANGYGQSWGTPFDLANLVCHPDVQNGLVDLDHVQYVRIIDIPGSGDFFDASTPPNAIYDPWPTFGSGGVDLDAVGVIHSPQLVQVTVDSGPHGTITPCGVPGNRVALPRGSNITFTITAEPGFHIAGVELDGLPLGPTNEVTLTSVTNNRLISATFGHRLTVNSAQGTVAPAAGVHYGYGPMTLSVTTPTVTEGGTQAICRGWNATGSLTSGVGTATGTFELTNDTTVSWLWDTNYALTVTATSGGQVNHSGGWYAEGSVVTSTAASDAYFSFAGWSGHTAGDTNLLSMSVTMDSARELLANFYTPQTTNGTPIGWLEYYKLTNGIPDELDSADGDLDGQETWREFLAGTDPTDRDSRFAIIGQGCVDGTNYVTWLGGTNGSSLPFSVYATGSLTGQWERIDGAVMRAPSGTNTWWHDCTNGASYYRVVVEP